MPAAGATIWNCRTAAAPTAMPVAQSREASGGVATPGAVARSDQNPVVNKPETGEDP